MLEQLYVLYSVPFPQDSDKTMVWATKELWFDSW